MRTAILVAVFTVAAACGALGVALSAATSGEPSEIQMRAAFEDILTRQVQNALDFAAETGGPEAVAAIRAKGLDRFTVTGFRKRACRRIAAGSGHFCDFAVDIEMVSGRLQRVISGRFVAQPDRLVFIQDV